MESKFIKISSGKLHYTISGSGNTLMLIHGFGEDGTIWAIQENILSEKYSLIIPDLPGSGKSDFMKMENGNVQLTDYAEIINDILLAEKIESLVMIGHSMGGYIALAFAEKYPQKLKGLGLFHSSAFPDNEEKIDTRRKAIEFIKVNGPKEFLKTSIPGLYAESFRASHPGEVEAHLNAAKFTIETLIQYYEAMIQRPDRTAVLKTVSFPVLFIIGELDQAVPLEQSLRQCHIPKISHIHLLPEVAHMGMIEAPDETVKFIDEFLQNI